MRKWSIGAPDIVVPGMWRAIGQEQVVGDTHVMPPLYQSKQLGVVDVEFTPGQSLKISSRSVALNKQFPEDVQVAKRVADAVIGTNVAPRVTEETASTSRVDAKPYYPSLGCRACHQRQYDDWVTTKHATALKTLVDRNRARADCLPCHSEMWRTRNQYVATPGQAAGVECATCHANVLPHGMERKGATVHVRVDPKLCVTCHTKDRSPMYDEKTYLPRVAHSSVPPAATAARPQ